jgi:hypothetical protein
MIGIDTARRARSGNSVGIIWNSTQANPPRFYCFFPVIWVVLGDFRGEDGDLGSFFLIGIDRARRARSGTSLVIRYDTLTVKVKIKV